MDALNILTTLEEGELMPELTEALRAVAAEVQRIRKPGKVSLSLDIKPAPGSGVDIHAVVGRGMPKLPSNGNRYFLADGEFHRNDPRQLPLAVRNVDLGDGQIRQVDTTSGELRESN